MSEGDDGRFPERQATPGSITREYHPGSLLDSVRLPLNWLELTARQLKSYKEKTKIDWIKPHCNNNNNKNKLTSLLPSLYPSVVSHLPNTHLEAE